MSRADETWQTALIRHGLRVFVDAAPDAEVVSVARQGRKVEFYSRPWLACVVSGRATVKKEGGLSYELEEGQVFGQVADLDVRGADLRPVDLISHWHVVAGDGATTVVRYADPRGLRRIWDDATCVAVLRQHLRAVTHKDPWLHFLERVQPDLFAGLAWPAEPRITLEVHRPNEVIISRGDRPSGLYIVARGFERETVERIARMVFLAEFKRRQAAPGIRVSARAFGRDRRYPITSGYRARGLPDPGTVDQTTLGSTTGNVNHVQEDV